MYHRKRRPKTFTAVLQKYLHQKTFIVAGAVELLMCNELQRVELS